jgi:hypothetical protein
MQHNGWDHALKVTAGGTGLVGHAARCLPGDPFHRGEGNIPDAFPRAVAVDELYLPEAWHREHEWMTLFTTACGPDPPRTAA